MQNGKNAGMLLSPYHFARPDLGDSAIAEAQYFVGVAGSYITSGYLRPALDLERGESLGKSALSKWVRDWAQEVERLTRVKPILYMIRYDSRYLMESDLNVYPLWTVTDSGDPQGDPGSLGPWSTWTFQQYRYGESGGTCPGITGDVDLDSFHGNQTALNTYLISGSGSVKSFSHFSFR
jgi:GH25 family lysozyme M1 (1,4-beta-N-acetylmuramidase)